MSVTTPFSSVRVLCVGDVMLDRYVGGFVRRISPESPIPVLSVSGSEAFAGGAANVARNIASIGGHCSLIGVVGEDEAHLELTRVVLSAPGVSPIFVKAQDRPTAEKTRFVAHGQHMLRADRELISPVSVKVEDEILDAVRRLISEHHVLVLSDYAKGVLTDRVVSEAIAIGRSMKIPVVVDPKSADLSRYSGATVLTPNTSETLLSSGIDPKDDSSAVDAGVKILSDSNVNAILITRAEKGMSLITRDGPVVHIPSQAREIADVVGAGDTVVATLALALGAGNSLHDAAIVANTAAGIVVGKRGTATVTPNELEMMLRGEAKSQRATASKVLTVERAVALVQQWKQDGHTVGFTNGCFDILHAGHISILEFSRENCGRLVVGINSDASVRRLKGDSRPVNEVCDRARVMSALAVVDAVVVFDEDTPEEIIKLLQPDVLVKGSDYTVAEIVGSTEVLANGGKVLRFDLIPGRSTTNIIKKAQSRITT